MNHRPLRDAFRGLLPGPSDPVDEVFHRVDFERSSPEAPDSSRRALARPRAESPSTSRGSDRRGLPSRGSRGARGRYSRRSFPAGPLLGDGSGGAPRGVRSLVHDPGPQWMHQFHPRPRPAGPPTPKTPVKPRLRK